MIIAANIMKKGEITMEQNKISNKLIITLIGIALITSIASLLMAIWCYNIKNNVSTEPKLNYTTAYIKFNDGTLMAVDIDEARSFGSIHDGDGVFGVVLGDGRQLAEQQQAYIE